MARDESFDRAGVFNVSADMENRQHDGDTQPAGPWPRVLWHLPVGALLRQYRLAAGLTQEQLAERAGLSAHSISNLERGAPHVPRTDTLDLLSRALQLSARERAALEAAITPHRPEPIATADDALGASSDWPAGKRERSRHVRTHQYQIPVAPTPLIGRGALVQGVITYMGHQRARLLTLTGSPGVGKTRLALEVACRLQTRFADGACFVALAALNDAGLVEQALATALGAERVGNQAITALLVETLRARELLLVLDNFEQVTPAAPLIAELLAACPLLVVLVTSRVPLRLRAEQAVLVPPLDLPDLVNPTPLDELAQVPAVALFVARAQACAPAFALTTTNANDVAALCHRLDGLPLAIELAAARTRVWHPQAQVVQFQLPLWLDLLSHGPLDLPPHQRALRTTLAWSYNLLPVTAQTVFRCLGVFRDGCPLDALQYVATGVLKIGQHEGSEEEPATVRPSASHTATVDAFTTIVEHSLAQITGDKKNAGEDRVRMLETIREYAWEQLLQYGEDKRAQRLHGQYYVHLVEQAAVGVESPARASWLARLDADLDNIRAALDWAAVQSERELGLRMVSALRLYWEMRASLREGYEWVRAFLGSPDQPGSLAQKAVSDAGDARPAGEIAEAAGVLAAACTTAASLAQRLGRYDDALAYGLPAQIIYQTVGDARGEALALSILGNTYNKQGKYEYAEELLRRALSLSQSAGDTFRESIVLSNLGITLGSRGDHAQALPIFEKALAMGRALGDRNGIAVVLYNIAQSYRLLGDFTRAMPLCTESIAVMRELGNLRSVALELVQLGDLAYYAGQLDEARAYLLESVTLAQDIGLRNEVVDALEALGRVVNGQGDAATGTRLYGMADALREQITLPVPPAARPEYERTASVLRDTLGAERFADCWAAGAVTPVDEMIAQLAESRVSLESG